MEQILYIRTSHNYTDENNELMIALVEQEMSGCICTHLHTDPDPIMGYKLYECKCTTDTAYRILLYLCACDMLTSVIKGTSDPAASFIPDSCV